MSEHRLIKPVLNKIFSWFESRIEPYPAAAAKLPEKGLLRFLWSCTDGVRVWVLALAVGAAGVGMMEVMLFRFMGMIVDWLGMYTPSLLFEEKSGELMGMALLPVLFVMWKFVAKSIRLQTLLGVFPMRLRWNFHRLMLSQSLAFYHDEFAGRVSAKVMQTALAVRDTVMAFADMVVYVMVYFLTSGLVLAALDGWLLLPFLLWLLLFALTIRFLIPRLGETSRRQADARSLMTGRITDAYANITTVKLFSHGAREAAYARESMQEFLLTVHAQMRLVTVIDVCAVLNNTLLILGTTALGIYLWQEGSVGVGAVAVATTMALRVNGLSEHLMWVSAQLFENLGVVKDGMNTLTKAPTINDRYQALPLKVTQGEIAFHGVDFAYEADKPLLQGFNLTIRAGEKVGLIGRSGAGKSTIVNLLLRFYDPQRGRITIDGQDISTVTQESLRAQIGLVTQDTGLLHRSVRDNIVYGRPEAGDTEMLWAAEQAEAAGFVPDLSDTYGRCGYDAHVGERGVKLSGGQRQRIAIARVMLKDAPILLLDEATSALDSEVEAAIQQSLDKMMGDKTVIAIAHRLSTIAAMDRLIVLDDGRIVEQGSHAELLAQNGLYAKLWAHQSGGFLPERV